MNDARDIADDVADTPGPDEDTRLAARNSLRAALAVAALGAAIAAGALLVAEAEYLTIMGGSLVALGLGGWTLLKLLFRF